MRGQLKELRENYSGDENYYDIRFKIRAEKLAPLIDNFIDYVETAKANKLVVERYLVYLFNNLSNIEISDSESLDNLMPWSNKIPESMKIKDMK